MSFKLAFSNIKKSIRDYSIYFFTLVVAVSIFYIFNSLGAQNSMMILSENKKDLIQSLIQMINYLSVFVSIILGFLIIYANNFLIRRRKKEFGLYLTLGMSKQNVSIILVIETVLVGLISLVVGLFVGIFLSQFLSIFTAKLFEADMTNFKFIFSSSAIIKTTIYFSLIYLLVMIFNVFVVSKYKIIDLLAASRKNEKVHFRNKYIVFISLIIAIVLYAYAYKLLLGGILFTASNKVIYMLVAGAIGTFFLFFSISGFFLKIFQSIKKVYYKNLNMFVLKQINSKVNTTVFSTTIICLMLLLTVAILSGSISLANVYNNSLKENNKTDFTINETDRNYYVDENGNYEQIAFNDQFPKLIETSNFKENVSNYVVINYYEDKVTYENLMDSKTIEQLKKTYGQIKLDQKVDIIKLSEYNKAMELFGKEALKLEKNEYALTANIDEMVKWYSTAYKDGLSLNINNNNLTPATKAIINVSFENYMGSANDGIIVVNDELVADLTSSDISLIGNYKNEMTEKEEEDFFNDISKNISNYSYTTKMEMENSSIGIKAIMIFIGLYLGIIFAISSATILAISQLSDASDNKNRYRVLKLIGADDKMTKKALFVQISIAFILPLIVALVHAYFGLKEVNGIIKVIGSVDLTSNIILTTLFIVVIYGGYFLATYLCSKSIIKEY